MSKGIANSVMVKRNAAPTSAFFMIPAPGSEPCFTDDDRRTEGSPQSWDGANPNEAGGFLLSRPLCDYTERSSIAV